MSILVLNPLGKILPVLTSPYSGLNYKQQVQINSNIKGVYYVFIQYLIDENIVQEKICKLLAI
jgi:hypothetical protein